MQISGYVDLIIFSDFCLILSNFINIILYEHLPLILDGKIRYRSINFEKINSM